MFSVFLNRKLQLLPIKMSILYREKSNFLVSCVLLFLTYNRSNIPSNILASRTDLHLFLRCLSRFLHAAPGITRHIRWSATDHTTYVLISLRITPVCNMLHWIRVYCLQINMIEIQGDNRRWNVVVVTFVFVDRYAFKLYYINGFL